MIISVKYVVMVFFVLLSPALSLSQYQKRPLVIVPGFLGSVLSEEDKIVWGNSSSLLPHNFRKLDLIPDDQVYVHLQPTDILRAVPLPFGLMNNGAYGKIIDFLTGEEIGYEEGHDLHVFYYDWRRTSFSSARLLRSFIDEKVGNESYDLIAHSLGGIVTRLMLAGERGTCEHVDRSNPRLSHISDDDLSTLCDVMYGTARHLHVPENDVSSHDVASNLHTYIEIAVPHYGSNDMIANFHHEEWGRLAWLMGGREEFRSVLNSFPSVVELLPSYPNCCALGRDGRHGNRAIPHRDIFSFERWRKMILDIDGEPCSGRGCVLRGALLAASLESRAAIHRVVEQQIPHTVKRLVVFAGTNVANTRLVSYFDDQFDNAPISFQISDEGDGTVPLVSAKAPEHDRTVFVDRTNHLALLDSGSLRAQLKYAIIRPDESWTIQVTDEPITFAHAVVKSTSVIASPQIALPGDVVRMKVAILTDSDHVDRNSLGSEAVSVEITRVDTGEVAVSTRLSLDAASRPASGQFLYTGTVHAPESPQVYVVDAMVVSDTRSETIGKAVLSVLTTSE